MGPRANDLTIDELARRTGMTVRNIRAHQARGLLAPPEVRGRTGFYGPDHVARLELVKELQADGFNLVAIGRLLADAEGSGERVLRFTRAARAAFDEETPAIATAGELAATFAGGERTARAAVRLGLLRPLGDGTYEVPSPRLLAAGSELAALGVPAERALALVARVRRHADRIAAAFVELFVAEVWEPFEAAGRPADRWPDVRDAVERLHPLAGDALGAIFALAMRDAVEEAFGRVLGERPPRGARGRGRTRRRRA